MSLSVWIERIGGPIEEVGNARARWARRDGILLRLVDADGRVGLGEASPLPGHSPDSLDEAFVEVERVASAHGTDLFEASASLVALAGLIDELGVRSPAARFALETAALDLRGQREGRPLHRLLAEGFSTSVPLSTLVDLDTPERTRSAARRSYDAGFRSFKAKIGGDRVAEREALEALRDELGGAVEIRLDANATLSIDEATSRLLELEVVGPSYVEEPTALHALASIPDAWLVPVALDESLLHLGLGEIERLLEGGRIGALVLKPMLLGGFTRCLALAELGARAGVGASASHLFDGPVALAAASELALALPRPLAAGLAPHRALSVFGSRPLVSHRGPELVAHDRPGLGLEEGAT